MNSATPNPDVTLTISKLADFPAPQPKQAVSKSQLTEPLDAAGISRVIEMAWEDRTPFDVIERQFGLNESAVIALMRREMKPSSFKMWRERVTARNTKHGAKRSDQSLGDQTIRHRAVHSRQC